ncbi:hypothetical protein AC579_7671 [Pseudocercospora musae]|uniref:Uncharacterized protein n=1 Tax=Pseudocercospora musae TaxID=113226 RepID=A0A139GXZ9_9PEZI|nr:hypothetical protein AC579_7671 [Pseudocercospora musae]
MPNVLSTIVGILAMVSPPVLGLPTPNAEAVAKPDSPISVDGYPWGYESLDVKKREADAKPDSPISVDGYPWGYESLDVKKREADAKPDSPISVDGYPWGYESLDVKKREADAKPDSPISVDGYPWGYESLDVKKREADAKPDSPISVDGYPWGYESLDVKKRDRGAYTSLDVEEGCNNVERKSRDWQQTRLIIEIIIVLLLLVQVGAQIFKTAPMQQLHFGNDPRVSSGAFDQFRQYGRDPEYFSFSHEQDYLWAEYLTAKPPPNSTGAAIDRLTNHGSVSMLHQLHCLAGIRRAIQQLGEGAIDLAALQKTEHAPHCFDYLRKVILCYADDFIERPRNEDGSLGGPSIEGAYDYRMCRSSERIFALGT